MGKKGYTTQEETSKFPCQCIIWSGKSYIGPGENNRWSTDHTAESTFSNRLRSFTALLTSAASPQCPRVTMVIPPAQGKTNFTKPVNFHRVICLLSQVNENKYKMLLLLAISVSTPLPHLDQLNPETNTFISCWKNPSCVFTSQKCSSSSVYKNHV